jgi:hypothetical protein
MYQGAQTLPCGAQRVCSTSKLALWRILVVARTVYLRV